MTATTSTRAGLALTDTCLSFGDGDSTVHALDHVWLCGPFGMIADAREVLDELGVPRERVHFELFYVDEPPPALDRPDVVPTGETSNVTVVLDGRTTTAAMSKDEPILPLCALLIMSSWIVRPARRQRPFFAARAASSVMVFLRGPARAAPVRSGGYRSAPERPAARREFPGPAR